MIKTTHYLLRSFREADIDNVYKGLSHPQVIKYYGVHFASREESKQQMDWYEGLEKNNSGKWWAICDLEDKDFYGAVGYNNWINDHRRAELGFWLLPDNWGKGILTELLPSVIFYGFQKMRLHRIEALVESENENCIRLLNKMDFTHEGRLMDYELKKGNYVHLDIYALLHSDNGEN